MSQPVIVLGDKTSHGGTVITCAPTSDTHGKGWARIGDMVACPRCKGVFPISEGDPSLIVDGQPVSYNGCKVACGASLIASQPFTTTRPSAGAVPGAAGALLAQGFGSIGEGGVANYQDEPLDAPAQHYRGRFRLLNAETGEPIAGRAVRVRSTGGLYLTGHTDAEGYTEWVEHDTDEALAFDLLEQP